MQELQSKQLFIKVDGIVAVYNAESTLEETVGSAMDQVIPDHLIAAFSFGEDGASSHKYGGVHFDVCICCYNDASTDKSLEILESLEKERTWSRPSSKTTAGRETCNATMTIKLLIGTAPTGTTSRGAGYARNQAVKLRDKYENNDGNKNGDKQQHSRKDDAHFLCILDSDDVMHPTRIAEQAHAMLSLPKKRRERTLMGCQFDRIPNDSTQHYAQWANSLSDERLYLEQFRECTLVSLVFSNPECNIMGISRYCRCWFGIITDRLCSCNLLGSFQRRGLKNLGDTWRRQLPTRMGLICQKEPK